MGRFGDLHSILSSICLHKTSAAVVSVIFLTNKICIIKFVVIWLRLTGGTPGGETGLFSIRHICTLLRLNLEENTIKSKFGWARKYPQSAHDLLGQAYYRGLEVQKYFCSGVIYCMLIGSVQLHAPAWVEYYKPGRSYNDIECFDVRKAEYSAEEMEKKRRAEVRERQTKAA